MTVRTMPRRRVSGRLWALPEIHARYERLSDGKHFEVVNRYQRDMQIRLEASDGEVHHPFLSMLETDYRPVVIS